MPPANPHWSPTPACAVIDYLHATDNLLPAVTIAAQLGMSKQDWRRYYREGRDPTASTLRSWMRHWRERTGESLRLVVGATGFRCVVDTNKERA